MKKRNRQPRSREALNSELIRRPIRRCWPLFLLPTALAFCIGFLYPFLLGLYRSFCEFTSPVDYHWAGFSNYFRAFADEGFRRAFGFTAAYAVVSILIINICAFALAYALTQKLRGSNIFRTVFFMPNLIGGIVLGYIWKLIFDAFLRSASLQPLLTNATYGFWGLVAKIDGAGRWQTLWHVTIPNVMPSVTICVFLTLTNSFKLFDQNLALTGGSPQIPGTNIYKTEMLALHIFKTNGIGNNWKGVAQAEAVIFFILVAALALLQLRATRTKEVQQ